MVGLSTYHVMIKRALLLPRIMPASQSELSGCRRTLLYERYSLKTLPLLFPLFSDT